MASLSLSLSAPAFGIRTVGRSLFTEDGCLCDFSFSGFTLGFSGNGITLSFLPFYDLQPVYVQTVLDGRKEVHKIKDGSETVSLSCPEGEHLFSFARLTEGEIALIVTKAFITADGEAKTFPAPKPERRMVFLGDSITCGYGVHGDISVNAFFTSEEDPTDAYAYLTATELGFAPELVSISGQGIVHNYSGARGILFSDLEWMQSRTLRRLHPFPDDADIVVVNGGTNDHSGQTTQEQMKVAASALLDRIAIDYPKAQIIWTYGLMGDLFGKTLAETVAEKHDSRFSFLLLEPISPEKGEVGAYGHPSVKGQRRAADELKKFITENILYKDIKK